MLAYFSFFLSWWGVFLLAAIDSTIFFFVPFGIDVLVIYTSARARQAFWIFPLLACAGSTLGVAATYAVGRVLGEKGLPKIVPRRQLERMQKRVGNVGAVGVATAALLPPPFPLSPFALSCGALKVNRRLFFSVFATARIIRFGAEALLARRYGTALIGWLESGTFRAVVIAFSAVAVLGTIVSVVALWRRTRSAPAQALEASARMP